MDRANYYEVRELDIKDMTAKDHKLWRAGGVLVETEPDRHFGF
ncbi:hypothetical protein PF005_g13914 [Phytophthora fragariae]|uniref:Uncharacterized protein n=1 Tax=Phytophthora fragariae TaxID=53985 RepID=A0A6A3SKE9_9STRA|nr:hypothetical protein PF010_g13648 [Phytophthora fragariae]KAE9118670.1 hypothetical protein PF007_g8850 [Phytophthora fragariae]KAE9204119.1 hypothetical protein PF005_g13914 [Phytophthora fragariae]